MVMMEAGLMNAAVFREPGVEFRPVPFWSWNGKLTKERLVEQIGHMHDAGVGGFFMHARNGLKTGYLDAEWFECVEACVEEAARLGMKAWIYDEKGWPSGFAGGVVPSLGREFRAKALVMLTERREDDEAYSLLETCDREGDPRYLYEWVQPMGDPRFESTAYVDLLDAGVTKAFIESTHRRYEEEIGSHFGYSVPGIFSDEACALLWLNPSLPALPWTSGLDGIFMETYGYSLLPRLNELFLPEGDYRAVRYDYWKLVVELFAERFSKTVYDWCESRGLLYTGHLMAEDGLAYQMQWVGDIMRQYEYMHIPGMDHLGRHFHVSHSEPGEEPYTRVLSAKQVSSVANQLGRERALSELFACGGQGFGIDRQKWMTDWHFIHGINLFSPHLLPYTLEGEGKRDYPPTIGPQQPWWGDYRLLTDYQARMSYALTRGKRVAPVLVIHPVESAFEFYSPQEYSRVDVMNEELERLSLKLLDSHLSFDYGNEHLIGKYGSVTEQGLRIKEAVYQAVLIPFCTRLRPETVELLEEFARLGFVIFYAGSVEGGNKPHNPETEATGVIKPAIPEKTGTGTGPGPDSAEAFGDLTPPHAARHLPLLPFSVEGLRGAIPQSVSIEGKGSELIWLHEREEGRDRLYFIASMSGDTEAEVTLRLEGAVHAALWDAETGAVRPLSCRYIGGGTVMTLIIAPRASMLIRTEPVLHSDDAAGASDGKPAGSHLDGRAERIARIPFQASPVPLDPNALVLDRFSRYDAGLEQWSEPRPVVDWLHEEAACTPGSRFRASVEVSGGRHQAELQVAIERPLADSLRWNGHLLAGSGSSWIDKDWLCFSVPADLVVAGVNLLEVTLPGGERTRLENVYIIGDFAVDLKDERSSVIRAAEGLVNRPEEDLTRQGFPFYAGRMEFSLDLDVRERFRPERPGKWLLRLAAPQGGSIRMYAQGRLCGARAWAPWEWDVTELLKGGESRLTFVMSSSLRNVIGPHHLQDDEAVNFLTPAHFFDRAQWTGHYVLTPLAIGELELICI